MVADDGALTGVATIGLKAVLADVGGGALAPSKGPQTYHSHALRIGSTSTLPGWVREGGGHESPHVAISISTSAWHGCVSFHQPGLG